MRRFFKLLKYLFNLTIPLCQKPFIDYGTHDHVAICNRPNGHGGFHSRWPLDVDL